MILAGFQPFTLSDFPGHMSAIVFTQGCPIRCPYCHNRNLWSEKGVGNQVDEKYVITTLCHRSDNLQGLVISGGEPAMQKDLPAFAARIKLLGFKVKIDTNGLYPEVLEQLIQSGAVDYIAMDIKAPWKKYSMLCGARVNTSHVQTSMDCIVRSGLPHHFQTTWYKPMLSKEDMEEIRAMVPPFSPYLVTQEAPCSMSF